MQIHLNEQDMVDACCVFVAEQHRRRPEDVEVDLQFDRNFGFSADARVGWHNVKLNEQDVIDAVAVLLSRFHNFDPARLDVDLQFSDGRGVEADVLVR